MRAALLLTLLFTAFTLLFTACGDDASSTAADRCSKFMNTVCTRLASCEGDDYRTCIGTTEATVTQGRGCGAVVAVRDEGQFDSCLAQLEAATCAELDAMDELPPECRGQLLLLPQ